TAMTGEVFAVLRRHSILGRLMPSESAPPAEDDSAFAAGLARAGEAGGLLHHLFGAIPEEGLAAYLSGILIGREIADLAPPGGLVHLIGAPALSALYARALEAAGHETRRLDPDCVARGLYLLSSY